MKTVIAIIAVVVVVLGAAWAFQRSLIFFPDTNDPGPASRWLENGDDVVLRTEDELTLSAWRVDPARPNGMAALVLPGNAGNRSGRATLGTALAEQGFTALLLDYRGYGGNPGSPSERGMHLDALAALSYLREEGFTPEEIIYVGESIGTGVATGLALSHPPGGLVLRSPFTSLADVARSQVGVPLGWLLRDEFDNLTRIAAIDSPVLVLAGSDDELVPESQSAAVAAEAPNLYRYVVVPGAGHNDWIWGGPEVAQHVAALAWHLGME